MGTQGFGNDAPVAVVIAYILLEQMEGGQAIHWSSHTLAIHWSIKIQQNLPIRRE